MAKYELRPLSENRKADIVRSALAQPSTSRPQQTASDHTVSTLANDPRTMMDRAFRAATTKA
ncbi:hypothetical protein PEC302107_15940 [Pectobacterium araliae]|uniref:Uncharacterized protein n=1 Tax=Pectobacterium araliae TaxID=3073862 RepID=A0AAN0KB68_9GAMM|nr:hypothetical protein PEC302110_25590 [Pectobacterium sp. MAFF 302110]GKW19865.1 hypothetical protein PEC302107_15940 [Pectobacterium carotovorum subsp. carotovorum]